MSPEEVQAATGGVRESIFSSRDQNLDFSRDAKQKTSEKELNKERQEVSLQGQKPKVNGYDS